MGSEQSRSTTYVANATGLPIRVYYSVDTLVLTELVVTVGATAENEGGSLSGEVKMIFKPDSRIRFIRIPAQRHAQIIGEGTIYTSVFVECSSNCEKCEKIISENFKIPSDRSFIVAKDCSLRFQKYGESIWMDENGTRHG